MFIAFSNFWISGKMCGRGGGAEFFRRSVVFWGPGPWGSEQEGGGTRTEVEQPTGATLGAVPKAHRLAPLPRLVPAPRALEAAVGDSEVGPGALVPGTLGFCSRCMHPARTSPGGSSPVASFQPRLSMTSSRSTSAYRSGWSGEQGGSCTSRKARASSGE